MRPLLLAALVAAAISGQALAGQPSAMLTVTDGTRTWTENLAEAGLINFDSVTGNFTLKQGSAVGDWVTTDNVDFWQWQGDGWFWHSAETASGVSLSIDEQLAYTDQDQANDPWASVAKVTTLSGHGDPDLSYGYYARNNTGTTQTYTFTVGESIVPPVGSPALVYADIGGSVTNPNGSLTITPVDSAVQAFLLSGDVGNTFTNAGVDVGPAFTTTTTGTSAYGTYSAANGAPTGRWNYMQIVTKFTLTPGRDVASLSGYASITPVPEPETYAMYLAGLGMIGAVARRRIKA